MNNNKDIMNLTAPSATPTRNLSESIEPSFFPTSSPTEHNDDSFNYLLPALLAGVITTAAVGFCYFGGNLVKDAAGHNIFISDS